jgi:tRNA(fMet)-specific endonuclease VapC
MDCASHQTPDLARRIFSENPDFRSRFREARSGDTATRKAVNYLLDTDTCIHVFRGVPGVIARIEAEAGDDLAISSVTYYELLYGVRRCAKDRREVELRKVEAFVKQIHVIPFGASVARHAADIRAVLEAKGVGIGPLDTLIAATAIDARLTVVTGNIREFGRVPGLRCESWIR